MVFQVAVIPMRTDAMEHVAYNPEDCFPLLGRTVELIDLSLLENGDVESVDDYPLSPTVETLFGAVSLTESLSRGKRITAPNLMRPVRIDPILERVDECCGLANLDEVPMELVTSDEEPESSVQPEPIEEQNNNYSTDLDEMELRSRALRSLLLKKKSPPEVSLEPIEDQTSKEPVPSKQLSKLLAIGSGRLLAAANSHEKFVITVSETSSDDEDEDTSKSVPTQANIESKLAASTQDHDLPDSTTEQKGFVSSEHNLFERQLLQQKMILLRQRLTVKRQRRIVDERRQLVRKLANNVAEIRKRLKYMSSLYRTASKSLLQAQRLLTTQQKKLLNTERSYTTACEKVSRNNQPGSQLKLVRPVSNPIRHTSDCTNSDFVAQRKDLICTSLNALQRARSTTAYFAFYRFESSSTASGPAESVDNTVSAQLSKPQDQTPSRRIASSAQSVSNNRVNPAIPLCPFLLDGSCKDNNCLLQHPLALINNSQTSSSFREHQTPSFSQLNTDSTSGNLIRPVISLDAELYCEVCKAPLINSLEVHTSDGLRKWHAAYLAYRRLATKSISSMKGFLTESRALIRDNVDCVMVADHHLALTCRENSDDSSSEILECLKLYQFPLSTCRCVLRHTCLTVRTRLAIAQSTIEYISSQLNSLPSRSVSSLGASFVYMVYHYSRLLLETASKDRLVSLFDELLSNLPKYHCCRFGVWWIKLSLQLTETLPPESAFFSSANLPPLSKTVIIENLDLVQAACSDLGIPDQAIDFARILSVSENPNPLLNCLLAMLYIHVHSLLIVQRYEDAAKLCWTLATDSGMEPVDDLFYPLAVYASFHANNLLDWTIVLNQHPNLMQSPNYVSYRIEFGFLVANLAWRKGMLSAAREALLESLASVIFIPSDLDSDILCVFQRLLHSDEEEDASGTSTAPVCGPRGHTYLWLSYCLYCLICSTHITDALNQLIRHCRALRKNSNSYIWYPLFTRLLLHMAVVLINKLHASNAPVYYELITTILCDQILPLDRLVLPAWFLEVVQRIQLASLPSPGERQELCVTLVENYGPLLVPSFCRGLFALGDRFLARSLCSIGKLDKPDSEAFWLLFASLTVNNPVESRLFDADNCLLALIELFTEATTAIPSSASLWRWYVRALLSGGLDAESLCKRAKELGINAAIFDGLNFNREKKRLSQTPAEPKILTTIKNNSMKTKAIPAIALSNRKLGPPNCEFNLSLST